jgi:hypothetical protein
LSSPALAPSAASSFEHAVSVEKAIKETNKSDEKRMGLPFAKFFK